MWLCDVIVPKTPYLELQREPLTELESILISVVELNTSFIKELSYTDHQYEMKLFTSSFDELIQRMETVALYLIPGRDLDELDYPTDIEVISLISFYLGCKREYQGFNEVIVITLSKIDWFIREFLSTNEKQRRTYVRRYNYLFNDIIELITVLNQRVNNHTL